MPSVRDDQLAEILDRHSVKYPKTTVAEARRVGLPISYALAFLEKESSGKDSDGSSKIGLNLFGHDAVRNPVKGGFVTEERYRTYLANRKAGLGMQGVGPCQLTWWELQDMADRRGGCWRPEANMRVGFALAKRLIKQHGKLGGAMRYNGTGPAAQAYAQDWLAKQRHWHSLLVANAPAAHAPATHPHAPPAEGTPAPGWAPKIITARTLGLHFANLFGQLGPELFVTGHYSAGARAHNAREGADRARSFHREHAAKGWGGVGYHYLISDDGTLFCLRPTILKGAHVGRHNSNNIGVNMPGTTGDRPTKAQQRTYRWLLDHAHTSRMPKAHRTDRNLRDATRRGHKQWPGHESNGCPGEFLSMYLKG